MTKMLLVDDIEENRYMLKLIMQAEGYDVVEANNGREALAAARENPPEIVITDILMPEMDGFQLCREWHVDTELNRIPFVFYTATYTDSQDEAFALSLGADLFIRKPEEPQAIVSKIRDIIETYRHHPLDKKRPSDHPDQEDYEKVLFRKLEKKVMELEQSKADLEYQIRERKALEKARQALEKQLRHAQRMDALGTLSAGIAHDFNNFLHGINAYAGLAAQIIARKSMSDDDVSTVSEYLDFIRSTCQRGATLVQQIRTFSTEAERDLKSLALSEHVAEALKLLHYSLPSTVTLREDIDANCRNITGDPAQIHQLVVNLCMNAFESTKSSDTGTVTVSLKEETVSQETLDEIYPLSAGMYAVLRIADTGEGMSPEVKDHIFEPYFTTKSERGGTGLGLAVVHGIVQSHGAAVHVESRKGDGTVFTVYFPLASPPAASSRGSNHSLGREKLTGRERILFVDDLDLNAELGKTGLELYGYRVSAHTSSIAALEAFQAAPNEFDIVITDLTIPEMSGKILADKVKTIRSDIGIILCTGASLDSTALGSNPNINEVLTKPVTPRNFAAAIRRIADSG